MRALAPVLVILSLLAPFRVVSAEEVEDFAQVPFEDLIIPEVEGDEARVLARELAEAGLGEVASESWEVAARQLEVSYVLDRRPEVLLPLARALREIGQADAARERLERLLHACPSAGADLCSRAQRELDELGSRAVPVTIATEPEGAALFVDGERRGTTPLAEPLALEEGEHQLRVVREGYLELSRLLVVESAVPMDLVLRLDAVVRPRGRGLDIALWAMVGLAAASAAALVVTAVVGALTVEDLDAQLEPTAADSHSAEAWVNASFWMAGATGATSIIAIALAAARSRRDREPPAP